MNLTKKEAVRLHRLLWNKIADIIERNGLIYNDAITLKHKAIEELRALGEYYGDAPFLHCFCCEYTENLKTYKGGGVRRVLSHYMG